MFKRIISLKYVIIAALMIGAIGACTYASNLDQKVRDQYQQKCQEFNAGITTSSSHSEDCAKGAENAARHMPLLYRVFVWPEGITTLAILLTLLVIADQTAQTRKAAEATAAGVEATKQQAGLIREQMDTQINMGRARLNLEVQPIEIPEQTFYDGVELSACIEITNVGHSNAFIKNGAIRLVLISSGQGTFSQASPEDFAPFSKTIEPSKEPVYCPVCSDYIPLKLEEFTEDLANSVRTLRLYGFIEYETMGIRWHRDFGYVWIIGEPSRDPPDPVSVIYEEHKNSGKFCIAGGWEEDLCRPNTEYRC